MSTNAGGKKVQMMDAATMVLASMRKMGISGIPRNYELVYEALNSSNPALTRDFDALGSHPTQAALDAVGAKYFAHHHKKTVVEGAHDKITDELETMLRTLRKEQSSLESYTRLLGETYHRISAKSTSSSEILGGIIAMLSSATGDTMEQGKVAVQEMVERAVEMEQVKLELDEYKRIANTDPLTRLANRRAFDDALPEIYNSRREAMYHALIVCDIDHFKKFNDSFGHPVGDRVLGVVAAVMRSTLRKDVFIARTGGEEFAVILHGTSQDVTMEVAERIRAAIQKTPLRNQKSGMDYGPITVSVGVCMASDAENATDLYNKADIALYMAKNSGRNQVQIFSDTMAGDIDKNWLIYRK
ncbi:GGDEF domain-containing protein [Pseudohoeflea suaedae]|uniref:diguanylate cyclase n=1 Tax=Pseudohoeflea suaedae TaxID=877384 RepID=A0A4R5PL12_9HYPH|nr:GGDEF domain-containing protein [Pseudohoeflea suaedae]TDH36008.1 GGDEF domain-containing protein [Pseudohoeflea suaedae]